MKSEALLSSYGVMQRGCCKVQDLAIDTVRVKRLGNREVHSTDALWGNP
jgi:hypothetical protein